MAGSRYIGLDWGTSSFRAYLFSEAGEVLDRRSTDWGIMSLPGVPLEQESSRASQFRYAFWQTVGDWLTQSDVCRRVVACGMVGSAQGWREAAYIPLPVHIDDVTGAGVEVDAGEGVTLVIASGLVEYAALPNVLRGEETQVAGMMALLAGGGQDMSGRWLLGLPGTHSKWVYVEDQRVRHFDTFMTGEVYALLVRHSILGRTMSADEAALTGDEAVQAFLRGVANAGSGDGVRGLLSTIFSSRTLGLTGALGPAAQCEYLSGLLLGHEVRGLVAGLSAQWLNARIALVGRPDLCHRYCLTLKHFGLEAEVLGEDAGRWGLWARIQADQQLLKTHAGGNVE